MVRPGVTGRKPTTDQALALSIAGFCRAHGISESMYFKVRAQGLGPREMIVGTRKLISQEAASEWRAAREASSAKAKQPAPLAPVAVESKPPRKSAQPVTT
jgi:hypothetical protein